MGRKAIRPFKNNAGISKDLIRRMLDKENSNGLIDIIPFETDKIVLAHWVHLKCRYGCRHYNTNWCCPPAAPPLRVAKKILGEYSLALLLVVSKNLQSASARGNNHKRVVRVRCWKETISMERMLFLNGYYKAFSLVGECCALCTVCAYPDECRFPQEKRLSVEAFGIDMTQSLRSLGITPRVDGNPKGVLNYYSIILLE